MPRKRSKASKKTAKSKKSQETNIKYEPAPADTITKLRKIDESEDLVINLTLIKSNNKTKEKRYQIINTNYKTRSATGVKRKVNALYEEFTQNLRSETAKPKKEKATNEQESSPQTPKKRTSLRPTKKKQVDTEKEEGKISTPAQKIRAKFGRKKQNPQFTPEKKIQPVETPVFRPYVPSEAPTKSLFQAIDEKKKSDSNEQMIDFEKLNIVKNRDAARKIPLYDEIQKLNQKYSTKEFFKTQSEFFSSFGNSTPSPSTSASFSGARKGELSITKFPLDVQLDKKVNEAIEEEFKYDLEIIDNQNRKEKIKVSFQPGKVTMVEDIPNRFWKDDRDKYFRDLNFTTDYKTGYEPIAIQEQQENELSYKNHFVRKKQSSASTRLKRVCGVSYVKALESHQKNVSHIFQKLPPLVFQGSSECVHLDEYEPMIKEVYSSIFSNCEQEPLIITTIEAEDELAMREYLQFPKRRLELVQGKVWVVRSFESLWRMIRDKLFICIHLQFDTEKFLVKPEISELSDSVLADIVIKSNVQIGILCRRSTSGKKAFAKTFFEGTDYYNQIYENNDYEEVEERDENGNIIPKPERKKKMRVKKPPKEKKDKVPGKRGRKKKEKPPKEPKPKKEKKERKPRREKKEKEEKIREVTKAEMKVFNKACKSFLKKMKIDITDENKDKMTALMKPYIEMMFQGDHPIPKFLGPEEIIADVVAKVKPILDQKIKKYRKKYDRKKKKSKETEEEKEKNADDEIDKIIQENNKDEVGSQKGDKKSEKANGDEDEMIEDLERRMETKAKEMEEGQSGEKLDIEEKNVQQEEQVHTAEDKESEDEEEDDDGDHSDSGSHSEVSNEDDHEIKSEDGEKVDSDNESCKEEEEDDEEEEEEGDEEEDHDDDDEQNKEDQASDVKINKGCQGVSPKSELEKETQNSQNPETEIKEESQSIKEEEVSAEQKAYEKKVEEVAEDLTDALVQLKNEFRRDPKGNILTLSVRIEVYTCEECWKTADSHTKNLLYTFSEYVNSAFNFNLQDWTRKRLGLFNGQQNSCLTETSENLLVYTFNKEQQLPIVDLDESKNLHWTFSKEIKTFENNETKKIQNELDYSKLERVNLATLQQSYDPNSDLFYFSQPLYAITTRDSFAFDLLEKVTDMEQDGRKFQKIEYFFDPEALPSNFKSFVDKFPDYRVGVTTYHDFFTHEELSKMEDNCYQTERDFFANHFISMTGQMTCTNERVRRTKFFFGARYMWSKHQLSEPHSRVGAGIRVDVSNPPGWMKKSVEYPLVDAGIVDKDFLNSFAMNVYHDGKEGLAQHFDDAVRFRQPIFSLRLFSDSRLSFGSQFYGFCNGAFCIPLPRGCICVLEEESYAANGIKHCVRPCDMTGKSAAIIMRQMHHKVFNEAILYDESVDFPTWFSTLSIDENAQSYSNQKRIEAQEILNAQAAKRVEEAALAAQQKEQEEEEAKKNEEKEGPTNNDEKEEPANDDEKTLENKPEQSPKKKEKFMLTDDREME